MIKNNNLLDRIVTAVLPISFIASGFLNAMAFPLGLHANDSLRVLVTFGIIGLVALLLFVKVVLLFIQRKEIRKQILFVMLIPAAFAVTYFLGLLGSEDKGALFKKIITNGCYLVSACCAATIIIAENRLKSFLRTCRIYALVMAPVVLYYCIRFYLPGAAWGVQYLGVMDYMTLAYCLLTFSLMLVADAVVYGIPANKEAGKKSWAGAVAVDFAIYVVFCVAITLSQTKGTILCVIWSAVLLTVYLLVTRTKGYRFPIAAVASIVIFAVILFPTSIGRNRIVEFLGELSNKDKVTVQDYENVGEIIDRVTPTTPPTSEPTTPPTSAPTTPPTSAPTTPPTSAPTTPPTSAPTTPPTEPEKPVDTDKLVHTTEVVRYVNGGQAKKDLAAGLITQEEYDAMVAMTREINNTATGARLYLWSCALAEIRQSPILGGGIMSFENKYSSYPHNYFLEVGADLGLPVMLLVIALGAYVFVQLIRMALIKKEIMVFALYVMTYLARIMISSSAYSYDAFFQYGFCILIVFLGRKLLPAKKKK